MKKTFKKIKSTISTSDKKSPNNQSDINSAMEINLSNQNNNTEKNIKNINFISKETLALSEENINKLKNNIDNERNNTIKDLNDLNMKLNELNKEINRLDVDNKYLNNNINSYKKNLKLKNNNKNYIEKNNNNIEKLNKKIKLNENMILNNRHNLKLLKKEKKLLEKEIKENDAPETLENLQKQLDEILKKEDEAKKEIEKLIIIKNEHEIVCSRKQKEYTKKIEIIKSEIYFEQKKKDIFDKINNQKILNINNRNKSNLKNNTDITIEDNINKNNEILYFNSEKKVQNNNKNIFNKNNSATKNIFNYYLRQFKENKNKKRKEKIEIKDILNSNINNNLQNNEIKAFSSINYNKNSLNNNADILNIKSINNKKNNKESNRALFTPSEKELLLKLIPNKILDNYEQKFDVIKKENLSLQTQLNDRIRLKTLTKQNNLIKLENSELINNVFHKNKLKLDVQKNTTNKKIHELKEKINHDKKLFQYYDLLYIRKKNILNKYLKKYRNIYGNIKNGNLILKKGAQLTQDNIICLDIYGKGEEGNTSFEEADNENDNGQFSENCDNYEDEGVNYENENEIENENNIENEDDFDEDEK